MDREFCSSRIIFHLSVCILNFGRGIYEMVEMSALRNTYKEVTDEDVADLVIKHTKEDLEDLYNAELYLKQEDHVNDIVRVLLNGEQGFKLPRHELLKAIRASIGWEKKVLYYWEAAKEGAE